MKVKHVLICFFLFACSFLVQAAKKSNVSSIVVKESRCEYMDCPLGIDVAQPMLSWKLAEQDNTKRGSKQTAYQVLISSSLEDAQKERGDVFLSEKIDSDEMRHLLTVALKSSAKYWWRVRVWNRQSEVSLWSSPAYWVTGILPGDAWQAEWITAEGAEKYALSYRSARRDFRMQRDYAELQPNAPQTGDLNYSSLLLEKIVQVKPCLKQAFMHVCGLGQYELSLNGSKVGDYKLAPGWSDYQKTVLYDTYDVTDQLKSGDNTINIILSNGIYNIQPDSIRYVKFLNSYGPLKVIAQLRLEYTDGAVQIISTDKTWKVAPGAVTYSNFFGGEDYDARLMPVTKWYDPIVCKGPGGELKGISCAAPAIKEIEVLTPVTVHQIKPTVYMYDLGQNTSVMPRIQVSGKSGSYIRIIPSELLGKDGLVDRSSATQDGVRPAWWQYTLSGKGKENWFPQFFYQGARYLQVELYPNAAGDLPLVEQLEGVVVHSSSEPISTFSCSNELFNRIYTLVRWAQRSNMMSFMTDCPQREKLGWLEETHLNGPALRYNFDMAPLFRKSMNDMKDSQLEYGLVPNIAPEYFLADADHPNGGFRNSPEWGSAFIIMPWQQYLFSGDLSLLERYYDSMRRYLSFLAASAKENIVYNGLGDWYDIGPKDSWGSQLTPVEFTATAIYFYDNWILSKVATLLGKKDDALIYQLKAEEIRIAFNKKFFNSETGTYSTNSQTTNAMPIALGIVEPEHKDAVLEAIIKDVRQRGNALTSGDVGYRFLLRTLADEGRSDVIYDMNNQSERPGYGYQLKMGATSLTEKWDAGVGSFGSQNHFMLGQINEWFFHDLMGLRNNEQGPGFKKFIIAPAVLQNLDWVKGSFNAVSGLIHIYWYKENDQLNLKVTIPVNTLATICIPVQQGKKVLEGLSSADEAEGVIFTKQEGDKMIYEVSSGNYHFTVQ